MGDLIDRKALLEEYDQKCTGECGICPHYENDYCNLIENAPTVEAVPVVHGEWIKGDLLFEGDTCSLLHHTFFLMSAPCSST